MSDTDWIEIDRAVGSSIGNFERGLQFAGHPAFRADDVIGAALRMGFMHAIQAGHTSLENALLRILDLIGETRPRGEAWHADLVSRAAQAVAGRPAILSPGLASSVDETRRFRNRATRAYDNFDVGRIGPTIDAARDLVQNLAAAIAGFRQAIDP
jgi:ribonuclease HepT-like protein